MARIALVKPDKARNVENMILAAAQRGALQSKVCAARGVQAGGDQKTMVFMAHFNYRNNKSAALR